MISRSYSVATSKIGDVLVLDVATARENETGNTTQIANTLFDVVEKSGCQKVLVDMRGIKRVTSDVIGQIVMLVKKCNAGEFQMKLSGVVAECKQALDLVHLDQLVDVYERKNQGIVAYKLGEQQTVPADSINGSADDYLSQAESGEPEAQFCLGRCFEAGRGVEQDFKQALNWYEKAANQEHAESRFALGIAYAYGIGAQQDFETAYDWFREAAGQGHAESQFWVGFSIHHGLIGEADTDTAARWYKEAAEQGHAEARDAMTELNRV